MRLFRTIKNLGISESSDGGQGVAPVSVFVSNLTGPIMQIPRKLGSGSTLSRLSNSNANLTLIDDTINVSSPIGYGSNQIFYVRENISGGLALEYPIMINVAYIRPEAPTLSLFASEPNSIILDWADGANNGSVITNRYVSVSTSGTGIATLESTSLIDGKITITGLDLMTTYFIRGYTRNAVGYSNASSQLSITTSNEVDINFDFSDYQNSQYIRTVVSIF